MLREVKNAHFNPLVHAFQLTTTSAPSVVANIGVGDLASLTRPAAGQPLPTFKTPYTGVPAIMVGTGGATASNGAYVTIAGAQNTTTLVPGLLTAGGVATDGDMNLMAFGWGSSDRTVCMPQRVKSTQNASRIIWGKFDGAAATVLFGRTDFAISRASQGTYTVNFLRPFARTPVVLALCQNSVAANRIARISAKTASGCSILVHNQTPSIADAVFYLVVIGADSAEETWGLRYGLENTQRKPRIVAGRVTYTAGTPSVTVGTGDFTVSDTGTGDCTINFTTPFAREPAILANSRALRTQSHSSTASTARILHYSAGAVATDPTSFDFIAVGSDDVTEY